MWGHLDGHEKRHVFHVSRDDASRCRLACRPDAPVATVRVLPNSGQSSIPACRNCVKLAKRTRHPPPPRSKPGWVASTKRQQDLESFY